MATTNPAPQAQQYQQQQQPPTGYAQYPNSYGQTYQSYSQYAAQHQPAAAQAGKEYQQNYSYGYAPQSMTVGGVLPSEKKSWVFTKMGLAGLNVIVGIIIVALSLSMLGSGEWGIISSMMSPVPAAAAIWSGAELITRFVRKFERGIHPGAHVALHLLIWIASVVIAGMCVTASVIVNPDDTSYCSSSYSYDDGPSVYDDCYDPFEGHKTTFVAVAAFYVIIFFLNLVLFIMACMDTARRNRALRNRPVMVIQNPAQYWGGWQPMPQDAVPMTAYAQHQQQQQQQPQQPQGQPLAVPQPTTARTAPADDAVSRVSSLDDVAPQTEQPQQQINEKGKGPENPHAVHEYYTPGSGR